MFVLCFAQVLPISIIQCIVCSNYRANLRNLYGHGIRLFSYPPKFGKFLNFGGLTLQNLEYIPLNCFAKLYGRNIPLDAL